MNNQIEEMASIIFSKINGANFDDVNDAVIALFNAGYRKQTEGELIDATIEQIIRKKAEVSKYWQDDVKQYRATQGYSDVEHDVDNFLREYGEAIEDVIKILDGAKMKGGE